MVNKYNFPKNICYIIFEFFVHLKQNQTHRDYHKLGTYFFSCTLFSYCKKKICFAKILLPIQNHNNKFSVRIDVSKHNFI